MPSKRSQQHTGCGGENARRLNQTRSSLAVLRVAVFNGTLLNPRLSLPAVLAGIVFNCSGLAPEEALAGVALATFGAGQYQPGCASACRLFAAVLAGYVSGSSLHRFGVQVLLADCGASAAAFNLLYGCLFCNRPLGRLSLWQRFSRRFGAIACFSLGLGGSFEAGSWFFISESAATVRLKGLSQQSRALHAMG